MDLTARSRPARAGCDSAPTLVGGAASQSRQLTDRAAVAVSAEMLGAAQHVLEMTVQYAKDRVQFGRPIGSFQAVKHRCADMLVDVEGMRSAVYYAAWCIAAGSPDATGRLVSREDLVLGGGSEGDGSVFRYTAGSGSPGSTTCTCS